jgi:hypothetical protein
MEAYRHGTSTRMVDDLVNALAWLQFGSARSTRSSCH